MVGGGRWVGEEGAVKSKHYMQRDNTDIVIKMTSSQRNAYGRRVATNS